MISKDNKFIKNTEKEILLTHILRILYLIYNWVLNRQMTARLNTWNLQKWQNPKNFLTTLISPKKGHLKLQKYLKA